MVAFHKPRRGEMESLGRCQEQMGLREDCTMKNLHAEKWSLHPQDQKAPPANALWWIHLEPLGWVWFCGPAH